MKAQVNSGVRFLLILVVLVARSYIASSQDAYFVDGYHGGIYGHYPVEWKTQFINDNLKKYPYWKICLEIEPDTWAAVKEQTPKAFREFRKVATGNRVEFTNPTYSQPYCWNISGESIIRQFQTGIDMLGGDFHKLKFTTYSAEEPCFTSCLPQLLSQLGFSYAVLKCPDTCWGGYVSAYGKGLVNWIGPDGTSILTVPRYQCEDLEENSTWQTTAWCNSEKYLSRCFEAGIEAPVGMCYQDAGWKNGPWIQNGKRGQYTSRYVTWREYFEKISSGHSDDDWHLSQEDIRVNLMWGSQVLQEIASDVRKSENRIIQAEKTGALATLSGKPVDGHNALDDAWKNLMMSQHHDVWIVPYNRFRDYGTWADAVKVWTGHSLKSADDFIAEAVGNKNPGEAGDTLTLTVYNTLGAIRTELVETELPFGYDGVCMKDSMDRPVPCSIHKGSNKLYFTASLPAFGYSVYTVYKSAHTEDTEGNVQISGNECSIRNSRYDIVFDLDRGGIIKSLSDRKSGTANVFADIADCLPGEIRGWFYDEGCYHSSAENPARVTVLKDTRLVQQICIEGEITSNPFRNIVTMKEGGSTIDFCLTVDWKTGAGVGEFAQQDWKADRRAWCDEDYKLRVTFPLAFENPVLYKDAPFDICRSNNEDTSFGGWSDIRHNIMLNWLSVRGENGALAMFADRTSAYSFDGSVLGLTLLYTGKGLWGMDYRASRPLEINYSIMPHGNEDNVQAVSDGLNEPPVCSFSAPDPSPEGKSFIDLGDSGYSLSAAYTDKDGDMIIRLYNAAGNETPQNIKLGMDVYKVTEIDLMGNETDRIRPDYADNSIRVSMPKFGIRTYKLKIHHE